MITGDPSALLAIKKIIYRQATQKEKDGCLCVNTGLKLERKNGNWQIPASKTTLIKKSNNYYV